MAVEFPQDENGDALRRLLESGDDLTMSRSIDFAVVFPKQHLAEGFSEEIKKRAYQTS